MNLLAILAALGLEQWHAPGWRVTIERAYVRQARSLERMFNGGTARHGAVAAAIAILPPVIVAGLAWWALDALHPLAALALDVVVLYALMGFRRFSHAVSTIVAAFREGDLDAARRALEAWRGRSSAELGSGDLARLAIERGFVDAYRQVFAVLFWFVLLPGPTGAILYRVTARLAQEWAKPRPGDDLTPVLRDREAFGRPVRHLLDLLDWIPVRLTAIAFAAVGDFEDAIASWRTQAASWAREEGGKAMGIVLASGAGALGVVLGGPLPSPEGEPDWRAELGTGEPVEPEVLPSAVGLVWRALVLWLAVILLVTIASLLP
ncbi:adenosylcobinamide-phosphate synthase [Burkholderiales bacterium]|nr:adenosylcobinamide-phosphate synthase [Burkholderiales bacterium]